MTPPTRKLLARLAIAALGFGYLALILLSLSAPAPVARPTPQEYEIALLPRAGRLLPDTAMEAGPEPLADLRGPAGDLRLPYLPDVEPFDIRPPEPFPVPTPDIPRIDPPSIPAPIQPEPAHPTPRPAPRKVDGDIILAAPPPPRAGPSRVLDWVAPDEELWVVARGKTPAGPADSEGSGEMLATVPAEGQKVPMPLKRTETFAGISGHIASVTVRQQFRNPYDARVEAVYRFPLPHNAAVNDFVITIGERRIRGVIRERLEAERIYREARRQGLRSVLLSQDAPSLFSHRVANVAPEEDIDVEIRYFHTLPCRDGWYEFVYPLVVRPRATRADDREAAELPAQRSGRDIDLTVAIDAGLPIEEIRSPSHKVRIRRFRDHRERARVSLPTARYIANRDFVLRYRVGGDAMRSAMLFHRSRLGGFFTFMLHPPAELEAVERRPVEVVFALDCSASMRGEPFRQARLAVGHALGKLTAADTFQIVRFAGTVAPVSAAPEPVTPAAIQRALAEIAALEPGGSTVLDQGLRAALSLPPPADGRLRFVAVLTDGFVEDEEAVLAEVERRVGDARVFSVGLGRSPNRYLLERMAQLGRGAVAYIGPGAEPAEAVCQFVERVTRPALTHVSIDWGSLRAVDVYPERIPDVYHGRPVVLVGRFRSLRPATVRIRGRVGGELREFRLRVEPDEGGPVHTGIAPLWARAKIADLARQVASEGSPKLPQQITRLALHFNLLTPLTRFIAIDTLHRVKRQRSATVLPPGLVPQGLSLQRTLYRP